MNDDPREHIHAESAGRPPTTTMMSTKLENGDRIVLRGLQTAARLEGCHGTVAAVQTANDGRILLAVHLDILKTFWIKPENVVREDPMQKHNMQNRATVNDGVLEPTATPSLGLPLMRTFAIVRWIVATQYLLEKSLTVQQVPQLPVQKSLELNAYAIKHWNDKHGVRECLTSFVHHKDPNEQFTVEKRFIASVLKSDRGMKSWHYGLQGDFWFVGRDFTGSFVIPDKNKDIVYKVVGICRNGGGSFKKPGESVSLNAFPHCMPITIVPWFGRLLYDTTVLVPPKQLKRAQVHDLAHKLHENVLKAIQSSRVIEYLAEIEEK